jgi:tRNA A-37 threonylcarbamoyl transferase component Bud32
VDYDKVVDVIMIENVEGESLSDIMKDVDPNNMSYIDDLVDKAYESIDSIHACGVCHWKISARKCILRKSSEELMGSAVWTDFSWSIIMDEDMDEERRLDLQESDIRFINSIFHQYYKEDDPGTTVRLPY